MAENKDNKYVPKLNTDMVLQGYVKADPKLAGLVRGYTAKVDKKSK